jgi:DNA polymerase III, delta subunit
MVEQNLQSFKRSGVLLSTKKIYENQLPQWTEEIVHDHGYEISRKALMLLVDHIGNDLSRIENEIEKILVNLGKRKTITKMILKNSLG